MTRFELVSEDEEDYSIIFQQAIEAAEIHNLPPLHDPAEPKTVAEINELSITKITDLTYTLSKDLFSYAWPEEEAPKRNVIENNLTVIESLAVALMKSREVSIDKFIEEVLEQKKALSSLTQSEKRKLDEQYKKLNLLLIKKGYFIKTVDSQIKAGEEENKTKKMIILENINKRRKK